MRISSQYYVSSCPAALDAPTSAPQFVWQKRSSKGDAMASSSKQCEPSGVEEVAFEGANHSEGAAPPTASEDESEALLELCSKRGEAAGRQGSATPEQEGTFQDQDLTRWGAMEYF